MSRVRLGLAALALAGLAGSLAARRPAAAQPAQGVQGAASAPTRWLAGKPVWTRTPTGQDIWDVRPARVVAEPASGGAMLDCRVTDAGGLEGCEVAAEAPQGYGFGAAALQLAGRYRMAPASDAGEPTAGARVRVPVTFDAQRVGGPMTVMAHPVWSRAPSLADVQAAYPAAADGAAGEAVVRCAFDLEGRPADCAVASEKPAGKGFGQAALALAGDFVVVHTPDEADILPGVIVDIPITFRKPDAPAPRTPRDPEWLVRLTPAAAEALFPPAARQVNALEGAGQVDCLVTRTGNLDDCRVAQEKPLNLGFGEAALEASKLLVMNPWSEAGEPFAGHRVSVPIRLQLKSPPLTGKPVWIRKPSERDIADLRPRGGGRAHLAGGAVLNCIVTSKGGLSACTIQDEAPKGYDFGAAVLEMAPLFRMAPKAANGRPTAGTRVLVAVDFPPEP